MAIHLRKRLIAAFVLSSLPAAGALAQRQAPSVAQALKLKPIQKDVEYDSPAPDEVEKCTIKAVKTSGKTGWELRGPSGQILRNFVDSDGDNVVDQWSYFKDGAEVYRDIDSNHNGKADQYRWFNSAGTRWGSDKNEDRTIDAWEVISAEEVSAELVAALRDHDRARFERLLLNSRELGALGASPAKLEEIQKRLAAAPAAFDKFVREQKTVSKNSTWVYFGGGRPGSVPQGTDESTADVTVYENVAAMLETEGKTGQIPIGTLVKVDKTWKLIEAPSDASTGLFFGPTGSSHQGRDTVADANRPSEAAQKLLDELERVEKAALAGSGTPELIKRQVEILEELAKEAKTPEDRSQWFRQEADVLSSAAQTGAYAPGVDQLKTLHESLAQEKDKELAAYIQFRLMTAEYNQALSKPGADYAKVQAKWLADLEAFVEKHPSSPDSAEAMLQLAIAEEFAGDDTNALKWYNRVVEKFPKTAAAVKSGGAVQRLNSVGNSIRLQGKSLGGKQVDLAAYKGQVVLIHYWSSDVPTCRVDLPQLEKMNGKYGGKNGLSIIGVSLDHDGQALTTYLRGNPLPWPQIWEEGGLNNRLANEMGILTLPTMILVDAKGKVINRNVSAINLDEELKTMLKPRTNTAFGGDTGAAGTGRERR